MKDLFKNHKWKIITIILFLIPILTNPSLQDYEDYTGRGDGKRTANYFLFSTYEYTYCTNCDGGVRLGQEEYSTKKHIGLCGNFFER